MKKRFLPVPLLPTALLLGVPAYPLPARAELVRMVTLMQQTALVSTTVSDTSLSILTSATPVLAATLPPALRRMVESPALPRSAMAATLHPMAGPTVARPVPEQTALSPMVKPHAVPTPHALATLHPMVKPTLASRSPGPVALRPMVKPTLASKTPEQLAALQRMADMPGGRRLYATLPSSSPAPTPTGQLRTRPGAMMAATTAETQREYQGDGALTSPAFAADTEATAEKSQVALNPATTGNELLLQMTVDNQLQAGLVSARQDPATGQVYLPLTVLLQMLGFPIDVAAGLGVAQGWFVEEQRTFKLDEGQNYVEIAGKRMPLPAGSIFNESGDMYVSAATLESWFPVRFDVSMADLAVTATTTEVLPQAARLAREKRWASFSQRRDVPTGPLHQLAYAPYSWPSLRLNYGVSAGRTPEGQTNLANNLGIQAEGQLLGMDSQINLALQQTSAGNRNGLTGGSIRLSRDDVSGTGFLNSTHVEIGDISLPAVPILGNQTRGVGLAFNNTGASFASGLDRFELKGGGPVGWDVEIYSDNSLLTFGTVGADGQYQFSDLNLHPGLNQFRIVLYGPQGQKQERRQSYYLGEGMIKQGGWVYQAGLTGSNGSLIRAGETAPGGPGTMVLNAFYGLNRNLTLNVGASSGQLANGENGTGSTVGLRAAYGKTYGQANVARFANGDTALTLRESLRVGKDTDMSAFYNRYVNSAADGSSAPTNSKGVGFADSVNLRGTPFRYGLTLSENTFADDRTEQNLTATQAWRMGSVAFSNSLGRSYTPTGGTWDDSTLSAATRVAGLPWRGNINYVPGSEELIRSADLSTQVRLQDRDTLQLQGSYRPTDKLTSLGASLQKEVGPVALGILGNWQSNNAVQVGLNLAMQLVNQGNKPEWQLASPRASGMGYGSADVLVYVDENQNGRQDTGEATLQGVDIRNVRTGKTAPTDAQGLAHLGDLLPNTETLVQVVEETLPDIYLRAASPWHILRAHRGYGGKVPLALVRYGEIGGTLSAADYTNQQVWLSNAQGKTLERLQVGFDGSFYFQSVPVGRYTIHASNANGSNVTALPVTLTKDEPAQVELNLDLPEGK